MNLKIIKDQEDLGLLIIVLVYTTTQLRNKLSFYYITMVLEATVLIIDNSEYSRNGDFPRTRYEAQLDSIEYIFQAKRNSNPENTLSLISAAGSTPKVLSTFTSEYGKFLQSLNTTIINGSISLIDSIQIGALTLKHRQNKLQHQRIIVFICSPINDNIDDLNKLAKKLKKNNIAIDIINFGETNSNTSILEPFIQLVNNESLSNDEQSHLLTIDSTTSSSKLLYEQIASSPIILQNINANNSDFNDNNMNDGFMDFGVDPSMDPELAMALRLSMEEEQQRQERLRQQEQQDNNQ